MLEGNATVVLVNGRVTFCTLFLEGLMEHRQFFQCNIHTAWIVHLEKRHTMLDLRDELSILISGREKWLCDYQYRIGGGSGILNHESRLQKVKKVKESWITSSRRPWIMNHGQKISESWIMKKFYKWIMNRWSKNIWESRIIRLKRLRIHPRIHKTIN